MEARIKVGISSWTEPTLVRSGWYPPGAHTAEARLRYYASRFPIVEVDSPYYALPAPHQVEAWVARTPAEFTMNVKAHALLTGHYTDPRRLPRDLQEALAPELRHKERLYPRDLGDELRAEVAARFRAAVEPLRAAGKLGVVLLQLPVWLPFGHRSQHEVEEVCARLPGLRLALEFRNRTWMSARHRWDSLRWLRERGLAYVSVDEPQGFTSSVPPVAEATTDLAIVRFHGRNARTWTQRLPSAAIRLDYRYRSDELQEWVPRIRQLASRSGEVHAIMNNCHRDDAVNNAAELAGLLEAAHLGDVRPALSLPLIDASPAPA
jgi:uncharacterized protein YecE (DUF72 family)